jgi:small ubiquitin-related modifier
VRLGRFGPAAAVGAERPRDGSASESGTMPRDEGGVEAITLKVVTQEGLESGYKCRMTTQLSKLMNAFCQRQGVTRQSMHFLFGGQRIEQDQTPEDLFMKDSDSIYVMVEQGDC